MDRENCDVEHGADSLLFRPASVAEACGVMNSLLRRLKQLSSCITQRDRRFQFLQIGFEKLIGNDQRLDRLARIAAASRDGRRKAKPALMVA